MLLALLVACAPDGEPATKTARCSVEETNRAVALEAIIEGDADTCELEIYLSMLDERAPKEGPWWEETFVLHTDDLVSFDVNAATHLMDSSAVVDAYRDPSGKTWLFYGEGDLDLGRALAREGSDWFVHHGLIGYGAINLAVSEDGVNFDVVEDFGIEGAVRGMMVDPDLVVLADGTYRLYYVGSPVPELLEPDAWVDGADHWLYYAESTDLVHWYQTGVQVVHGPNADPSIHCFAPKDDGSQRCIGVATGIDWLESVDGGQTFDFTELGEPWGFGPELVGLADGAVRLFYNSKERGGALHSWMSEDAGQSWVDQGEQIPAFLVEAPSFVVSPVGGWDMYFHYWVDGVNGDTWGGHDDTGG